MNESTEIIKAEIEPSPSDALEIIQSRNILFDKIMAAAIQSTHSSDWIDQDGKPYLQASGSEKVARRFGVRIFDVEIDREEIEDGNGKYYLYTVMGKAAISGRDEIEAIGTCSSRDRFFGKSHGEFKATADVDMGNIKKKAYTNFMGNAITRLLGIRNLTWEALSKYNVSKDGKTTVRHDSGASKAAATKTSEQSQSQAKKPYWTSDYNGKSYVFANVGKHFSEEFIKSLGMKPTKKDGVFSAIVSQDIMNALADECAAAEIALREEAANGTAT